MKTNQIHRLSVAEALATLRTDARGLTAAEARRRLDEYGPNRVQRVRRRSAWRRLRDALTGLFSLVLWAAAGLAWLAGQRAPELGMNRLALALVVVIVVSGIFSFWQEHRAERMLAALRELLPTRAVTLRDGACREVAVEELVPGDIVLLGEGDRVPADARVVEATGARVGMATLTGEAAPADRSADASRAADAFASANMLFAGTTVLAGRMLAVIVATGGDTEFGRIARMAQKSHRERSTLSREVDHLSRVILALALLVGLAAFAIGRLAGIALEQDLLFTIGIVVAMVPEGLQPTLTLALVLAAQRMAKRNVLIRNLPVIETLGCTTVICTDKTGTLTQNRMSVAEVLLGIDLRAAPAELDAQRARTHRYFFLTAGLCHGLRRVGDAWQGDPMDTALLGVAQRYCAPAHAEKLGEIPFAAERMRASVMYSVDGERLMLTKGAAENIVAQCRYLEWPRRELTAADRRAIFEAHKAMTERGLRVLALACRNIGAAMPASDAANDFVFCGLAGFADPPRPEVAGAIARCRQAGIRVVMITGDHPDTALHLARAVGLVRTAAPTVVCGEQLQQWSDTQLGLALDVDEILFARTRAEQKLRVVECLQRKREIVAVTGDGVNDAPALSCAHIGIAMGMNGTDVAKEAADMVLLDDNFASIVSAVEEGRAIFGNIRKFLLYILTHNTAELLPFLAFGLFGVPLALTPIQALSIDMCTDSLPALGLGTEPPERNGMRRPPRPRSERLLDPSTLFAAYLWFGLIEGAAGLAAFFLVLYGGGWHYGSALATDDALYMRATTATLTVIVLMQMINVHLCRSERQSLMHVRPLGNRLIVWGMVAELAMLVAIQYVPPVRALLATTGAGASAWLVAVPFGILLVCAGEWRKWMRRRSDARRLHGTSTAAPSKLPARRSDKARLASRSG